MSSAARPTLEGQVAVITGASSGIGAAVARELGGVGMRLVLTARRADRLEAVAAALPGTLALAGDVTQPGLPARLIERALAAFGRCDVVVNNAGVIELGTVESVDLERVAYMVRVNVEAAFRMAHVAVRHFTTAGAWHLVNISSVLGTKVRPTAGAYAGTKFAIEALSEAWRIELANTAVRVSCIEPGLVVTELHRDLAVHPRETLGIDTPLAPEDVARCVRFVLEQPEHVRIPRLMILPRGHQI